MADDPDSQVDSSTSELQALADAPPSTIVVLSPRLSPSPDLPLAFANDTTAFARALIQEQEEQEEQEQLFLTSLLAGQSSRARRRARPLPSSAQPFSDDDDESDSSPQTYQEFLLEEAERDASFMSRSSVPSRELDSDEDEELAVTLGADEEEPWAAGWGPPLPFGDEQHTLGSRLWRNTPLDIPRSHPLSSNNTSSERRTLRLPSASLRSALLPTPPSTRSRDDGVGQEQSVEEREWQRRRLSRSSPNASARSPYTGIRIPTPDFRRISDSSEDQQPIRQSLIRSLDEATAAAALETSASGIHDQARSRSSWTARASDEEEESPTSEDVRSIYDFQSTDDATNDSPQNDSRRGAARAPYVPRSFDDLRSPPPVQREARPRPSSRAAPRTTEETHSLMARTKRMNQPVYLLYCGSASPSFDHEKDEEEFEALPRGFRLSSSAQALAGCGALVCARGLLDDSSPSKRSFGPAACFEQAVSSDLPPAVGAQEGSAGGVADLRQGQKERCEIRAEGCLGCKVKEIGCISCGNTLGFRTLHPCQPCSAITSGPPVPPSSYLYPTRNSPAPSRDFHFHFRHSAVTLRARRVGIVPEQCLDDYVRVEASLEPKSGEQRGNVHYKRGRIVEREPARGAKMRWKEAPSAQADFDAGLVSEPAAWLLPTALKSDTWWIEHGVSKHGPRSTSSSDRSHNFLGDLSSSDEDEEEHQSSSRPRGRGVNATSEAFANLAQPRRPFEVQARSQEPAPFSRSVAIPRGSTTAPRANSGGSPSGVTLSRSHAMRISVAGSLRNSGSTRARVEMLSSIGDGASEGGRRVRTRRERVEGMPRDPDGIDELLDGTEEVQGGYGAAFRGTDQARPYHSAHLREIAGR